MVVKHTINVEDILDALPTAALTHYIETSGILDQMDEKIIRDAYRSTSYHEDAQQLLDDVRNPIQRQAERVRLTLAGLITADLREEAECLLALIQDLDTL